ncbi:unnamed protein product, partial [marine sediment metagenome]
DSLSLILAEDVISKDDIPVYNNSAMDGYAVRTEDIKGADRSYPVRLILLAEDIPAGKVPTVKVNPGYCIPIMTGSPIPPKPAITAARAGSLASLIKIQ